jgi:hypothetical protein
LERVVGCRCRWAWHVARRGSREGCTGCWWGNLRETGHWGDPVIDERIILRWMFRKLEGVVGIGWRWLKIGTGGGHLWVRWGTFWFHKNAGNFLTSCKDWSASHEGLCSME